MDFLKAIEALNAGQCVRRRAWKITTNMVAGNSVPLLYNVAGSQFTVNRAPLTDLLPAGTVVNYHAHVDKLEVIAGVVHASVYAFGNDDFRATDWEICMPEIKGD